MVAKDTGSLDRVSVSLTLREYVPLFWAERITAENAARSNVKSKRLEVIACLGILDTDK